MPDYTGGQFPSLDGDPEAEVAQRTEPETDGSWFRHVFTVHNRAHTVDLEPDHDVHLANHTAVIQRALQQGLHPKAQPELESEEPCPSDPDNHTNLTYRVRVVPAVADTDPYSTVTPSNPYGDPDGRPAYDETPVESDTPSRWTRGEGGVDEHGAPLVSPQRTETEDPDSGEFIHSGPVDEDETSDKTSE